MRSSARSIETQTSQTPQTSPQKKFWDALTMFLVSTCSPTSTAGIAMLAELGRCVEKQGANPNAGDAFGTPPLLYCVATQPSERNVAAVKKLAELGARTSPDITHESSPYSWLKSYYNQDPEMQRKGSPLNKLYKETVTALHRATPGLGAG